MQRGSLRKYGGLPALAMATALPLALAAPDAEGAAFSGLSDWIDENLIDPQDGKLDISDYLAGSYGFFPVPIIITEPAVGFGFGVALAYFHKPRDGDAQADSEARSRPAPPSISVAFGAATENDTYLYGGAHSGIWRNDTIRYLGAIAGASVNLKFYLGDRTGGSNDEGIRFNVDGSFLYQDLQFRLQESDWWLGANYLYINAENTFRLGDEDPGPLPDPQFDFNQAGLGVFVQYDSRNTTFTPSDGMRARLEYRNYDDNWGSDFDYDHLLGELNHYTPLGEWSSLGIRLQGETVDGEVPFFAYPFVNLRGIPALRYQGETVLTGEVEVLWGFTPRWSLALFAGVGNTQAVDVFENSDETVGAGGAGFRYRVARKLGLQVGMDVARGPEETAFYLTVGGAW